MAINRLLLGLMTMDMAGQILVGVAATVIGGIIVALLTARIKTFNYDDLGSKNTLSDLADAVYQVLRRRVPHPTPLISYYELTRKLPTPFEHLAPNDDKLFDALGEITKVCRKRGLPTLSALVVRKTERTPGKGYYPEAHPRIGNNPSAQLAIWDKEWHKANSTNYPENI